MSERTIRAVGLTLDGDSARLLDDVSVEVQPGRILAVTGPSGSGKTTLLNLLGGLLAPTEGSVTYDGQPVGTRSGEPRAGTALVLQTYGLVPTLTAEENVTIALRARRESPAASIARAQAALTRVGIEDLADRLIQELSGGQLQRVAVARALATEPDVLLADEPTSELDELNRDLVVAEIRREADKGVVVVLATHDAEVAQMCDEELHLVDGRVFGEELRTVPTAADGPGHEYDAFRRPGEAD
jgi:putative ABC transport system ATP-binding protein